MAPKSNSSLGSDSQQQISNKIALLVDKQHSATESTWTIEDSESLYGIKGWGEPYFSLNTAGNVTVAPQGRSKVIPLDLHELVESLKQRNVELPLLIRFSDILADRMELLYACMNRAIARYNYGGKYQGVFPIKCNQDRHLISDRKITYSFYSLIIK